MACREAGCWGWRKTTTEDSAQCRHAEPRRPPVARTTRSAELRPSARRRGPHQTARRGVCRRRAVGVWDRTPSPASGVTATELEEATPGDGRAMAARLAPLAASAASALSPSAAGRQPADRGEPLSATRREQALFCREPWIQLICVPRYCV